MITLWIICAHSILKNSEKRECEYWKQNLRLTKFQKEYCEEVFKQNENRN
jgi:hypothetical protein